MGGEPMTLNDIELAFRLLGPLEIRVGGRTLPVRSAKQRILLAVLLLRPGSVVPMSELAAAMWETEQPQGPRRAVQVAMVRLRALLSKAGCKALVTWADGYRLDVPHDFIDVWRFRRMLDDAARARLDSNFEAEAEALREALSLWRGEPLADVPSDRLKQNSVPPLREERLLALERRFEVDLHLGRHMDIVGDLVEATTAHPLRERLWAQLMTALHRGGRRAEALSAYHAGRRHLADELGVDPDEELRELHATILGGGYSSPLATSVLLPAVPRQLPTDAAGFTGRVREVALLDELLCGSDRADHGVPAVVVINGTAGVGKTALALHWSRTMADRFPDGQLWVNLRGYDHRPAMAPSQALTLFLRALGVPEESIPPDVDGRSALYRSLMDGRRALVVLDNASATEQVWPLLPGSAGNAVIVTSRNPMTGLVARNGARPLSLNLFTTQESHELLSRRLRAARVAAEPDAVQEIIDRCARLPLALVIAAARAAQRPGLRLATIAEQLRATRDRLDEFSSPEMTIDARAVFHSSYRSLHVPAARLFRLLGGSPGPDASVDAIASVAGQTPAEVRPLLNELTDAGLVTEHDLGRYTMHDLLRAYAAELADAHDRGERRAALHRTLDHYLHTAHAAALLVDHLRDPILLGTPEPGTSVRPPRDRERALTWFSTEYTGLLAAIERAGEGGYDTHAWQLVWTLAGFQELRGMWNDRAACLRAALRAARRLDDRAEQARAHRGLGYAYTRMTRHDDAHVQLWRALDLYDELRDPVGQGRVHRALSYLLERQGDLRAALWHAERALQLYPPEGNTLHRARAMTAIGWCYCRLGDHWQGLRHSQQALALLTGASDHVAEAAIWDNLGYAQHHLGNHRQAIGCYGIALQIRRSLHHRYGEANTLSHLGDTHQALGEVDFAKRAWHEALDVLEDLGEPDAERVRAKLGGAAVLGGAL